MTWPTKKRRLSNPAADPTKPDSCNLHWLASITGADDGIVATYFIVAANRLVELVVKNEIGNPDCLFMPIAFLYRHGTELILKDLIQLGTALGVIQPEEASQCDISKEHRLNTLWALTEIGLTRRWPNGNKLILENVRAVINDLHNMDPDGQGFRYSRDTKKRSTMSRYPKTFSLGDFRATMAPVYNLLDACREEFIYDLSEKEK